MVRSSAPSSVKRTTSCSRRLQAVERIRDLLVRALGEECDLWVRAHIDEPVTFGPLVIKWFAEATVQGTAGAEHFDAQEAEEVATQGSIELKFRCFPQQSDERLLRSVVGFIGSEVLSRPSLHPAEVALHECLKGAGITSEVRGEEFFVGLDLPLGNTPQGSGRRRHQRDGHTVETLAQRSRWGSRDGGEAASEECVADERYQTHG